MRVLAIGDIHGCRGPLDDLLAWVQPASDDRLIFLGDYVDRGPDTRGVLNRLMELRQSHPIVCLRGNHEIMMIDAYYRKRADLKMWLSVGGTQTLGSYGPAPGLTGTLDDVPPDHWQFLQRDLVDYYEDDEYIFVHATVDPTLPLHEQPENALFWDFLPDMMRHHSGKIVICGHSSQKSGWPKIIPGAVCIDTYAHGGGWLTCLDVHTGHYWQVDLLGRRREDRLEYQR
ncbi:MAG: metallophosphoesterase family protein [Gemmataceae bacterium]|nr:metallophosphoesterase family protein [Gemmataceae bacterium]